MKSNKEKVKKEKKKNKIILIIQIISIIMLIVSVVMIAMDPIKNHLRKKDVETKMESVQAQIIDNKNKRDSEVETSITFVVSKDDNKVNGEQYEFFGTEEEIEEQQEEIEEEMKSMPSEVVLNCIGTIEISSINQNDMIFDNDSVVELRYGIGHHPSSVMPGEDGNCCLLGHHMRSYGVFFNRLSEVKIGDNIKITKIDGSEYNYQVDNILNIDPIYLGDYVDADDGTGKQITLVSCIYPEPGVTWRVLVIGHMA